MIRRFLLATLSVFLLVHTSGKAQTTSFDGAWEFAPDSAGVYRIGNVVAEAHWRPARVPLSWQAQFADLRDYQGVAWYRKEFTRPAPGKGERCMLHFGAVDYVAQVFVNALSIGKHEGGYTPFEFDITDALRSGRNDLVVRVMDPSAKGEGTEGINYRNIPHGKQSWYVQTSGIWQSVTVRLEPRRRVSKARISATPDGRFRVAVWLHGLPRPAKASSLTLTVLSPRNDTVLHQEGRVPLDSDYSEFSGIVDSPLVWSPSTPRLYTAILTLDRNPPHSERFGFRSIETKDGNFLLNGEPIYLIGALDQDFWPETMYTIPSEESLRDEMRKAKEIGLNLLRCHIKAPDPLYLKVADEVGLLVWYEIPNWDVFTPATGKRALTTFAEMLDRDWNHPSLVICSLINEGWGLNLQDSLQRAWLKNAYASAKRIAPGRLIVDNSTCDGNFHVQTDINDYHTYWAIPENRNRFAETIREFSARPGWLFSPFGDAKQTGKEPLMLSEFGNWGLPHIPNPAPWWLERPFGDASVVLPAGYLDRVHSYRYDELFKSYAGLSDASQRAQYEALKYEIETIRLSPQIGGYVITEFTDIDWESNGLLDMWRNKKFEAYRLPEVQQQDVIIPRPLHLSFWSTDSIDIPVWVSHFSGQEFTGCTLRWSASWGVGSGGTMRIPEVLRGSVVHVADVKFLPFDVKNVAEITFDIEVWTAEGRELCQNKCSVFVSAAAASGGPAPQVHDPAHRLGKLDAAVSHTALPPPAGASSPMVTTALDDAALSCLDSGGTVVCFVDTSTRLPRGFPATITRRDTGWYDGNWASNLNWSRRQIWSGGISSVWNAFSEGRVDSATFTGVVLSGIPAENFDDVVAGMFVGWVRLNAAYVLQLRGGRGKLLLSSIPPVAAIGRDPYATAMFRSILEYAGSDTVHPRFEWKRASSGL